AVDQTVAAPKRVHAERRVDEGAALGVGELPVNEHPADRAMHSYLAKFIHLVYEEVGFIAPDQRLAGHQHEPTSLLETLALDLKHPGKPFGVATRVGDELPHRRDGRVEQRLLVDLGHQPKYLNRRSDLSVGP